MRAFITVITITTLKYYLSIDVFSSDMSFSITYVQHCSCHKTEASTPQGPFEKAWKVHKFVGFAPTSAHCYLML